MSAELPTDRRWKFPIIPFFVGKRSESISTTLLQRFEKYYVPDIADVVGRMYTTTGIHSLFDPAAPLVGPALTVKCPPGDNVALKKALTLVQPGDVIVVDAQGFSDWCLGGFQMLRLAIRDLGLKGLVVHGAYRDSIEAKEAGFPIYASAKAAWSGPKIGPGEINVPVCCGGVVIHPGDLISASGEGVVVVPRRYCSIVADHLDRGAAISEKKDTYANLQSQNRSLDEYLALMETEGKLVRES